MSSKPLEFVETAKRILSVAQGESDFRAAASRAYYGALHEADLVTPTQFAASASDRRSESSHRAILGGLQGWGNSLVAGRTEARQIERILKRMKARRQDADYELDTSFESDVALDVIEQAEKVLQYAAEAIRKASG